MNIAEIQNLIDEYVSKYEPLDISVRKEWFAFSTTGDADALKRQTELETKIRTLNSDSDRFKKLKEFYGKRDRIDDVQLRRQVEVLYRAHLPNQVPVPVLKELTELELKLQKIFNDYRPVVDGKELTPAESHQTIVDSTDSSLLEKTWKAEKGVAKLLEGDYRKLVALRNKIARDLGYRTFLELKAEETEMSLPMLDRFYSDVRKYTDKPFKKLKEEYIDPRLAERCGIDVSELEPWHYQNSFFQEAPTSIFTGVDLDSFYEKMDSNGAIEHVEALYASMGMDVTGIVRNSSLFPKPGKDPHACAWCLNPNDPASAVLIMNLPDPPTPPKASDVETLVHELGHDVHYVSFLKNKRLPYLLKNSNMLSEAFAMLMEKQTRTKEWYAKIGADGAEAEKALGMTGVIDYVDQLIFARWAAVIYDFERAFYDDPSHDIGDLWWWCKKRNQLLTRPEGWKNPDALAKIHIPLVSPLYYSNYAIGRVVNVQFAELFASKIGVGVKNASYYGRKEMGSFITDEFLAPGNTYRWDAYVEMTTGKPFSVDAWKGRYIDSDFEEMLFE